ncbi:MAG: exosortase F system-associated protein [Flavobacteriaceae bacterium]
MKKIIKIGGVIFLFGLLFMIRAFEENLFYDPLIIYFQNDYLYKAVPKIDTWHLIVDMFFRYTLNSIISLAIIYLIFRKKKIIKFSGFFLMLAFMVLIVIFSISLRNNLESGYLFAFYVRRFIVHPMLLLILLPAFYYQGKFQKK